MDDLNNKEETEYLPVGSVVMLKGAIQRIMIISRAVMVPYGGGQKFFDYGACVYPVGIIDDKLIYFNKEDIVKVYFKGYVNEDEELLVENIKAEKKQRNID